MKSKPLSGSGLSGSSIVASRLALLAGSRKLRGPVPQNRRRDYLRRARCLPQKEYEWLGEPARSLDAASSTLGEPPKVDLGETVERLIEEAADRLKEPEKHSQERLNFSKHVLSLDRQYVPPESIRKDSVGAHKALFSLDQMRAYNLETYAERVWRMLLRWVRHEEFGPVTRSTVHGYPLEEIIDEARGSRYDTVDALRRLRSEGRVEVSADGLYWLPVVRQDCRRPTNAEDAGPRTTDTSSTIERQEQQTGTQSAEVVEPSSRGLSREQKAHVVRVSQAISAFEDELVPRSKLKGLGLASQTVDYDCANHGKKGDRVGGGPNLDEVFYRREYLLDFVTNRWKPRRQGRTEASELSEGVSEGSEVKPDVA